MRLTFQKGNVQKLQVGLNMLFKTQKTRRVVCSSHPALPDWEQKKQAISVKLKWTIMGKNLWVGIIEPAC